jgi:mono/diheme cytochrome c family protein
LRPLVFAWVLVGLIFGACAESGPTDADYVEGRSVYGTCAACHGRTGEGGAGPSLESVRETFPDCADHVRWVSLGSQRWKDTVGPTYGAQARPINGAMPEFGKSLTPDQLKQIAVYERVRFGGADLETEKASCGVN